MKEKKEEDHKGKKAIIHGREYEIIKLVHARGAIHCNWKEKDGTPKGDTYINISQLKKFK